MTQQKNLRLEALAFNVGGFRVFQDATGGATASPSILLAVEVQVP